MAIIEALTCPARAVIGEELIVQSLYNNGLNAKGIITSLLPLYLYSFLLKEDNTITREFFIGNSEVSGISPNAIARGVIVITDSAINIGDLITVQYGY